MFEYINVYRLKGKLRLIRAGEKANGESIPLFVSESDINSIPLEADVERVVRCEDCLYCECCSIKEAGKFRFDDFCSHGRSKRALKETEERYERDRTKKRKMYGEENVKSFLSIKKIEE